MAKDFMISVFSLELRSGRVLRVDDDGEGERERGEEHVAGLLTWSERAQSTE